MKYLSFKILIICILLPPLCYLSTVNFLDGYLTRHYEAQITNIYLSDITDILNGLVRIREGVNGSINHYLRNDLFVRLGGTIEVSVTTRRGNIIYPSPYPNEAMEDVPTNPTAAARDNFQILNEGLELRVNAVIRNFSFIGISILIVYILVFMAGLFWYYRKMLAKARLEDARKDEELIRLHELQVKRQERIRALAEERHLLLTGHRQLQEMLENQKLRAEKTEEDLFDEIDQMEKKLAENLLLQEEQDAEIDQLKEKIQDLEKTRETVNRQKEKACDKVGKRFKVLYKNIEITERGLMNLVDMPDDRGLKAEELIHQLNEDSSLVSVKRKVFSRKGKITAFEVVFAYNGRLYFRHNNDNRIEILTIGTKQSQARDLAYLDSVGEKN